MITIEISNQAMIVLSILGLVFLPQIHLLLIIIIFEIAEYFNKIIKFIANLIIQVTLFLIILITIKNILEVILNILKFMHVY
jgi:hypothetical protein